MNISLLLTASNLYPHTGTRSYLREIHPLFMVNLNQSRYFSHFPTHPPRHHLLPFQPVQSIPKTHIVRS